VKWIIGYKRDKSVGEVAATTRRTSAFLRQKSLHSLIFHRRSKFYVRREKPFLLRNPANERRVCCQSSDSKVTFGPTQRYIPLDTQNVQVGNLCFVYRDARLRGVVLFHASTALPLHIELISG
jgi:hypothetical protein